MSTLIERARECIALAEDDPFTVPRAVYEMARVVVALDEAINHWIANDLDAHDREWDRRVDKLRAMLDEDTE